MFNQQEFIENYIKAKISGEKVEYNEPPISILKRAEKEGKLFNLCEDIQYCLYVTEWQESFSVIMTFLIELTGPATGKSSVICTKVIDLIDFIYNYLRNMDYRYYQKIRSPNRKTNGYLTIIKKIEKGDII